MKKHLFALPLAFLIAVILVSGCTQTTPTPNPTATSSVTIQNFAFSPQAISVTTGTTITWTNQDSVPHTITADTGQSGISDLASSSISPGGTFTYTFRTAGTWTYHCGIHPSMKGTVVVQ